MTTEVPWPGGREDESRVTGDPSDPNYMVKYSGGELFYLNFFLGPGRVKAKAYKGSEVRKLMKRLHAQDHGEVVVV